MLTLLLHYDKFRRLLFMVKKNELVQEHMVQDLELGDLRRTIIHTLHTVITKQPSPYPSSSAPEMYMTAPLYDFDPNDRLSWKEYEKFQEEIFRERKIKCRVPVKKTGGRVVARRGEFCFEVTEVVASEGRPRVVGNDGTLG